MKLHKTQAAILKSISEGVHHYGDIADSINEKRVTVSYHVQVLKGVGLIRIKEDGKRGEWELVPGVNIDEAESRESLRGKASEGGGVGSRSPSGKIERLLGQLKGIHDELESEFIALSMNVFTPKEKAEFERMKKQDEAIQAIVKNKR